jgi:hypothetical protein
VNLQENIRRVLKEDTGLKTRLENMMKNKGIIMTSKSVGGVNNLIKALGLDIDDLKTQEMLVKNFIYDIKLIDVEISFLEVNRNRPDKVRIKIYFKTNLMASNMESWVISTLRDEMNKFFPFKSTAVYEPAFAGRNTTVVLDSEQIEESEEDGDDFIMENDNKLKDKVLQLINNKGILIAGRSVGGFKNLVNIVGKDEIILMLKPPFFHNLYNIGASNRDQSNMIQDLLRFYLSNDVEIGEISGLNDGGDIYVENKNGDYIYFETYDGKEWDINDFDDNNNNIYYEDSDGYWFKQKFDEYGNTIYKLDSYGNETTNNVNESSDKSKEEPTNSVKENLLKLKEKIGFDKALKAVGGLENFIRIVYGGDIKKFFEDNDIKPYRVSSEPNLYISDIIVQSLELKDAPFSSGKEKDLGDFYWVSGGIRYKFNGYLRRVNSAQVEWRVVGQSGDSGFGYSFITKKNTLGKRARMQIFQQIIDKYNLQKYI